MKKAGGPTWAKFAEFLEKVGHGLSVDNASDLDVIAFVQGIWLARHRKNCQTKLESSGEKVASASAVRGVVQQLGKSYSMKGRTDEANPAKQESVKSYCEGYQVWLRARTECARNEHE